MRASWVVTGAHRGEKGAEDLGKLEAEIGITQPLGATKSRK